jgi:ribosomal protein S18 acetylase RimI-like enzyme
MHIRQAVPADSLILSSLCRDVQGLHAEHHPESFKMPQSDEFAVAFFDEMLADPAASLFIAEENGRAIGYIICKLFERPENLFHYVHRFLQIEHIAVRPDAQQHGAGTALMNQAGELAREIGVLRIQLKSWAFNSKAHAFFEGFGFEKIEHRFWRNL